MNRKLVVLALAGMLSLSAAGLTGAISPVRLYLNGQELPTDIPPVLSGGRTLVPLRAVAEALGMTVEWDEAGRAVQITDRRPAISESRVTRLEQALAPRTALDAATRWAEGVQGRNGALQYAVLTPERQKEVYQEFQATNWSTGVSSPWVESFRVTDHAKVDEATYQYTVDFRLATSTGSAGAQRNLISVQQIGGSWYIGQIGAPEYTGPDEIILNFVPQPAVAVPLAPAPDPDRVLLSEPIAGLREGADPVLHILAGAEDEMEAYLEDGERYYNLAFSTNSGSGGIEWQVADLNGDGKNELELIGQEGATVQAAKIFSFTGEAKGWYCLLDTENLVQADLDADGKADLVATAMGSLPPYLILYHWENGRFARADVLADTGYLYATLLVREGRTYIEAGNPNEPHYFVYQNGKLTETTLE